MTEKNHQYNSLQAIALLGKMSAMQLAMEVVELRASNPAVEEWRMMCGDWRDELVSLHGQNGHIVSGLTVEQARAIIDAHGGVKPEQATRMKVGIDVEETRRLGFFMYKPVPDTQG